MNPKACANCEHMQLLSMDASNPVPGLCAWGPSWVHVVDARVHACAQFRMLPQPRYTLPDEQQDEGVKIGGTE